jgi:hypothetical protein
MAEVSATSKGDPADSWDQLKEWHGGNVVRRVVLSVVHQSWSIDTRKAWDTSPTFLRSIRDEIVFPESVGISSAEAIERYACSHIVW